MAINRLLLFLIAGISIGSACTHLPSLASTGLILAAALFLLLLYLSLRQPACLWAAALGFGVCWSLFYGHGLSDARLPDHLAGSDILLEGYVVNLPEPTERGERFDFLVSKILSPQKYSRLKKIRLNSYDRVETGHYRYQPGQHWRLRVRLKPPRASVNPYGFDYEGWLLQQGFSAVGYVRTDADNALLASQANSFSLLGLKMLFDRQGFACLQWMHTHIADTNRRALFAAIALGYKEEFTRQHWDLLKNTGTIHLVVVSGLNIVLAATVGYFLCGWLSRALVLPLQFLPAPVWGSVGAILLAVYYAGMTGLSLPTQRSLIMVSCGLTTFLCRQHIPVSSGFLLALLAVLLFDPLAAYTASLWLSFGAVAILLFCFSSRVFINNATDTKTPSTKIISVQKTMALCLTTQGAVSLGLFPLLAYWMGSVPLVMPIANLFAVPFATFVLLPLTIASGIAFSISPQIGDPVLALCSAGMDLFWWFLKQLAQYNINWYMTMGNASRGELPSLVATCLAMLGVTMLLSPRGVLPRWYGCLLLLPLLFPSRHPLPDGEFSLTLVDVGQGLAVLVETANTMTSYDVGDRYSDQFDIGRDVVAAMIRRKGYDHVDTLVISHADSDHAGGLNGLLSALPVTQLLSGNPDIIQQRLDSYRQVAGKPLPVANACQRGQHWRYDGVLFEVLGPDDTVTSTKRNNRSCVLKVGNDHFSVLLTGDIESDQEQWLVTQDSPLFANVLVVPHHGSKTSSSEALLQAVAPQVALVSVGYKSQYGHPHPAIIERYRQHRITLWRTDQAGALSLDSQTLDSQAMPQKPVSARMKESGYWHRW